MRWRTVTAWWKHCVDATARGLRCDPGTVEFVLVLNLLTVVLAGLAGS